MAEKLQCDLVMRGGITSGIVYPRAIAKLAETYDFRSIGGTSAGAIAAAGTAAAAYGAKHGKDPFQTGIKGLPGKLSEMKDGKTVLERLFQPQKETRRLFRVLMSSLGRENKILKVGRIVAVLCVNYWPLALLGAAIALLPLLAFALTSAVGGTLFWVLLLLGLLPALVFIVVAAAIGAVLDIIWRLPKNDYGLCRGSSNNKPDEAGVLPLTDWLHDFFQTLANRPPDQPLTFGNLWGTKDELKERDIELVLMTTNVTRGVSQRLPFLEGSWGQLFFNKEEFGELFPTSVVEWMEKHPADIRDGDTIEVPKGWHPLPKPADLPIVLGARMSLSFPFLLSAVPLYAANFETKPNGKTPLERCWFSDGGLTSNFPIHFFDAPLPSRPTFAINLIPDTVDATEVDETEAGLKRVSGTGADGKTKKEQADAWDKVWMPSRNSIGIGSAARFNEFDGMVGFFAALFDTARNWADTELMALPGYRDRVVHVKLGEDEGGLNLSMPPGIIGAIGKRGELAGKLLAARYAPQPGKDPKSRKDIELTWDNHRWIRFRAFMAAVEQAVRRMSGSWEESEKETRWRSYAKLLGRTSDDFPKSYPFANETQAEFVKTEMERMVAATLGSEPNETFDQATPSGRGRSPRPKPVLRMRPPGSNDPRDERAG
jgi:predicted acylesterase/phospholipase RssA